jgi:hypothetical protein
MPDPLGVFQGHLLAVGVSIVIGGSGALLALLDPGGVMQRQEFDWFDFEMLMLLAMHVIRAPYQIWRTRKTHQKHLAGIRLLDVLSDARGAALFENFLKSELADENLKFWREGVKWKLSFDRDLSSSQQMARILFKTFVDSSSVLPINLSDATRNAVASRFKAQKVVSRTVFDEALVEVYKLMESGPFLRFMDTSAFLKFKEVAMDFSLYTMGVFNLTRGGGIGGNGGGGGGGGGGVGGGGGSSDMSLRHVSSNASLASAAHFVTAAQHITASAPRKSDLAKFAATAAAGGANSPGGGDAEFHISSYVASL